MSTAATAVAPAKPRYDRSIVEGPLRAAVWKMAWPTMLTNVIGGLQGMIDHVLVGMRKPQYVNELKHLFPPPER